PVVAHVISRMLTAMLRRLFETLILPPASVLVLFLAGTLLLRWRKKIGRTMQVLALAWLWLAATPCIGGLLLHSLQSYPALPQGGERPDVQAIVVLSAGADLSAEEYGGAVIGPVTLQRLRYAVSLQRRYGQAMLVSGGSPDSITAIRARLTQPGDVCEFIL